MKIKITNIVSALCASLCGLSTIETSAQGIFQNLNFESAVVNPVMRPLGPGTQVGPAFPGWTVYYNSTALTPDTLINYNFLFLGEAGIDLINQQPSFGGGPISNYTAVLQGSTIGGRPDVSLAQTGTIPAETMSLRFQARQRGINRFIVSLNGQSVPYGVVQDYGDYISGYTMDISAFAGQTVELRFTQRSGGLFANDLYLDNIAFSPTAVPEPGTWALLALGGTALWCAARRRGK